MTDIYEHPVSVNREKQQFITDGKVYKSWSEAMQAVKNSLQNQQSAAQSK